MEVKSNSPLLLFRIQIELSSSCFSSISFPSFSASNQQGGGRGPIILSLHPHPNCFREIFIKPACSNNILKIFCYSYHICQHIWKSFQKGDLICQMVFSPIRLKIAKLLSPPNFYFDQFCPAASHLLAFSNECMYVSCQTKIWMPEINWFACHEWQVTMVTNFPAIFSHFSIFEGKLVATDWPRHRKPNQLEEKQVE